ncbi:LacI family DNA-binding transcriptional regulator [Spirilliplanes yamanashiensis]|uniref:Transcriptional regulator n=1 Tax=Spirilliplanes yamanashiensis TaxID=42233 RepID=A0A8J3YA39_9ACTN|nr:LacI family DNA-binding transcriptional regulator [Spirilliplanes yamanashiensis]MDP9818012.1 LacI family transcriptional regulator [Spirilliplanes yamanashiensis]GIJ04821.1 transcriptional regulator [Spirilliplanes yamanashiensis]
MADVGRLAGVSPTAVSFVINGRVGEISDETRDRVLDAVRQLGYRPNRAARGLRTRRSHTIGVVTGALDTDPAVARTVAGAHDAAAELGSRLVLACDPGGRGLRGTVEDLLDRQVDALLVAVGGDAGGDLPAGGPVPAVLVNVPPPAEPGAPAVLADEHAAGRSATALLLAAGHRRIAVLCGGPHGWPTRERLAGHRAALAAAGLPGDPGLVVAGPDRVDSGHRRAARLLACGSPPTALLCGSERVATGAYLAIAAAGLRVPDDVSVVAFDDGSGLSAELRPALSTVHLPFREMGARAVRRLLLAAPDGAPGTTRLPCPVIRRASVAGPPAARPAG